MVNLIVKSDAKLQKQLALFVAGVVVVIVLRLVDLAIVLKINV